MTNGTSVDHAPAGGNTPVRRSARNGRASAPAPSMGISTRRSPLRLLRPGEQPQQNGANWSTDSESPPPMRRRRSPSLPGLPTRRDENGQTFSEA